MTFAFMPTDLFLLTTNLLEYTPEAQIQRLFLLLLTQAPCLIQVTRQSNYLYRDGLQLRGNYNVYPQKGVCVKSAKEF